MKQEKNSSVTHRIGGQLEHLLVENPLMATVKLSRYKYVSKMLNPCDVVVDIGCGSGLSTSYFSKYCSRVVGCDNNRELKNSWPQEVPENLTFVHSDIFEFVPPSDLSAVVCLDFIEHFNRQEGEEIVRWAAVS